MASEFLFLYSQLNLILLISEEKKAIYETGLLEEKAVEIFEYEKNNDGYWDGAKLQQQVINKVLPIAEVFYPGYSFLFLFDNVISHFIYVKDAFQVKNINKRCEEKQLILCNRRFDQRGT